MNTDTGTALENANDAILLYDLAPGGHRFRIALVNRAFEEQTGYGRAEVLGAAPELLYGRETDRPTILALHRALHALQPARGEILKYRKDGSVFWTEVNMRPVADAGGRLAGVVAIQRDITRRKFAEEQLTRTRSLLDAIMRNTRNVIFAKDLDGRYLFINDEFARLHLDGSHDMLGRTDFDIFPHDIATTLRENDARALAAKAPLTTEERIVSNGRVLTYLTVKFVLVNEGGKPYAICGIATDITERVETLNQLQLLQVALDQARDAIAVFRLEPADGTWRIEYVNEMMLHMRGYDRSELVDGTTNLLAGPETDVEAHERSRDDLKHGYALGDYGLPERRNAILDRVERDSDGRGERRPLHRRRVPRCHAKEATRGAALVRSLARRLDRRVQSKVPGATTGESDRRRARTTYGTRLAGLRSGRL